MKSLKYKNILFICTGNSCRSPMAEALMKKIIMEKASGSNNPAIFSAGTSAFPGMEASRNAVSAMKEAGMDISTHRSKNINVEMIEKADIILTMEKRHRDEILEKFPNADNKVYILREYAEKKEEAEGKEAGLFDIYDPVGGPFEEYERTAKVLKETIEKIVEYWLRGEKD